MQDQQKDVLPTNFVIGPDGEPTEAKRLTLGIEKFSYPGEKHFRLIWILDDEAWLAEEDTTHYRRKYGEGGVVEAGRKLAEELGARRFSEATR